MNLIVHLAILFFAGALSKNWEQNFYDDDGTYEDNVPGNGHNFGGEEDAVEDIEEASDETHVLTFPTFAINAQHPVAQQFEIETEIGSFVLKLGENRRWLIASLQWLNYGLDEYRIKEVRLEEYDDVYFDETLNEEEDPEEFYHFQTDRREIPEGVQNVIVRFIVEYYQEY